MAKTTQKTTSTSMEDMLTKVQEQESTFSEKATANSRPIPKGMVVFYGTDKDGKAIEGFQTPAGALAIKRYIESQGGQITVDEKKKK